MEVNLMDVTVAELTDGYEDNNEEGVKGYGGELDIRPPYQREFVYKEAQRNAVVDTILKKRPLNLMYWAINDEGTYEIIDGQQRTISICQYKNNDFSIDGRIFDNLTSEEKQRFRDYKLLVYTCEGEEKEKLEWFETINIAGEELTKQELRNAVYTGPWVTDAKKYFSKRQCKAHNIGKDYLKGAVNRQEYLETAILWATISTGETIEGYMSRHQHEKSAEPLLDHFEQVIEWVKATFPGEPRKEMKGLDWGGFYSQHKEQVFDSDKIEAEVAKLMADDEVKNKKGIYQYVLTREERYLNLRLFDEAMKRSVYEKQKGLCAQTDEAMPIEEMEADHIIPWSQGGKTTVDNCQMVSREYNRRKGAR